MVRVLRGRLTRAVVPPVRDQDAVTGKPEPARYDGSFMPELAYVSTVIEPSMGVVNKLESQAKACSDHGIDIDFYWMGRGKRLDPGSYRYLKLIHLEAGGPVHVRRQQAKRITELLTRYDHLVLRYPLWDPVLQLLLREKRRIVLELHTNYMAELRAQRSWRYVTEGLFGGWLRSFGALVGVAPEVLDSQVARSDFRGPTAVIPNGIDVASFVAEDTPLYDRNEPMKILMVASYYYRWHGLEEILGVLERATQPLPFQLHLVGELTEEQRARASRLRGVVIRGVLALSELKETYRQVHAGLTCFNLANKGMTATAPLKTREYLAAGLPIIGGYLDPALPRDFAYQLALEEFDVEAVTAFVESNSNVSRAEIQREATPYIDSALASQRLLELCRSL